MIFRQRIWLALIVASSGCTHRPPLPPIPEVVTSGFLPSIRRAVEDAIADAKAKPEDPAALGRLAMLLHAYGQLSAAEQAYRRSEILDSSERRADWSYYRGVVLLADGKAAEAAPVLEAAAQSKKNYLPALIKAGEAYWTAGDSAKAQRAYRKALEWAPNEASAHFGLGRATQDSSEFEKALDLFPNYGAAMFGLAQSLQRSGQDVRAKDLFARYERFKSLVPPLEDPLLDAVSALNVGPTTLVRKAQSADAQGDLQSAIQLHLKALELDPKMVQAQVNLISLYGRSGEPEKAAAAYRAAVGLNPNLAEAHYNYGVLQYSSKRNIQQAKAAFQRAITADASHALAHHNLGVIMQGQGQLSAAQQQFEKAIEIDPSSRNSRFQLGRVFANAGRYPEALAQFERIVTVEDDSTPTYFYALAATTARMGDAAKARNLLVSARQKAEARGQTQLAATIDRDLARMK